MDRVVPVRGARVALAALLSAIVAAGLAVAPAVAVGGYEVVVPYGGDGYRYQVVAEGAGAGFEQPDFVDTDFFDGTASFGKSEMCAAVTTEWPKQTDLLVRRTLQVPDDARRLYLGLRVVGSAEVFVNGIPVTDGLVPGGQEECPRGVDVIVPEAALVRGGENVVAIRARSMPWGGHLDLQAILVPVPPNDDVADATVVDPMPFTDRLSLLAATVEDGEPTDVCPSGGCATAWYRVTPAESGPVLVEAIIPGDEENVPLGVALYAGEPFGALQLLASQRYWEWPPIVVNLEAGVPYLVQVAGANAVTSSGGEAVVTIAVPPPPFVEFEMWPESPVTTGDRVKFWHNVVDPAHQQPQGFSWDFGDGTASSEDNPSHYFQDAGDFDVTLTVTMPDGRTGSATKPITVTKFVGVDPIASFTFSPEAPDNLTDVLFTATSSDPSLVGIERWSWDFGDGSTGEGENAAHRFASEGDYTVTHEIETFDGRTASTSAVVSVTRRVLPDPVAAFGVSPEQPFVGQQSWFWDQTYDPAYVGVSEVAWDFGDGTTGSGTGVYHAFAAAGTFTVSMTATTSDGRSDTASRDVTVAPPPAPEVYIWWQPWDASSFDTIQFSANAWDPAGVGIESYAWDFGDGATSSDPYPVHRYAADGAYRVTLTVRTPDGRDATAAQDVTVATHDVAIVRLAAAKSANAGQVKPITADVTSRRSTETVVVQLLRGTPQGYTLVAEQVVEVRKGRNARVTFDYLFTPEDASFGRVTFKVTATIQGFRDALPADNEAITSPTKVSK